MTSRAVWRIQVGEHGWIREVVDGSPIVTAVAAEAWEWPTREAAQEAADALPAGRVSCRVVPGPPGRRVYFDP